MTRMIIVVVLRGTFVSKLALDNREHLSHSKVDALLIFLLVVNLEPVGEVLQGLRLDDLSHLKL